MRKKMVVAALMAFLIAFSVVPSFAVESEIYPLIQSFTWKEYWSDGSRILKESGAQYGIGATVKGNPIDNVTLKGKTEIYGGSVGYKGQNSMGDPENTDTNYIGYKIEADLGYRFKVAEGGKAGVEPFVGLGWRNWLRDIQSTETAVGYTENWKTLYGRAGVRADYKIDNNWSVAAEGGLKIPFWNENSADIIGFSTKVNPGKTVSGFAEVKAKYKSVFAGLYYEGERYSASAINADGFMQPESTGDVFGLRVGFAF